ncbi:MAG: c-type cytochrome [Planctomycetaceae bacterium]|nr:c-type cytochrome [Planctomycetaceae bacterium]
MLRHIIGLACVGLVVLVLLPSASQAQVTPEQRRELLGLSREIPKIGTMIRKKEYEEAGKQLEEIRTKVEEIAKAANMQVSDRAFAGILTAAARQQAILDKQTGTGEAAPVSFTKDVASIINTRCLNCHGPNNPRNNLRLDTFAGWKQGGKSGPLLVPGAAVQSLLLARVSAPMDQGRMPPNGEALSREEIQTIASWVNQGAKFDGQAENMVLADLIFQMELKELDVKLPKSTGKEVVSFTRDIAPWFSNLCLGCHNERRKSGGLSVATFFDIMKGGDSGEVIIPGDMENSRLFRLVGGLELPRMPQGQARITRKNYEDLKLWFKEGNTFDGGDVRTNISTYVRDETEVMADRFAAMTNEEMAVHRDRKSREQFQRAVPNDKLETLQTERLLLLGNVSTGRLKEVQGWADEQIDAMQKLFNDSSKLPWRGRLAVFVMKDRFSYDEFVQTIEQRRAAAEMVGHSVLTKSQEDAYIVLYDVGDESTAEGPSLQINLIDNLAGAYVRRGGGSIPEWMVRGLGLSMAAAKFPQSPLFRQLDQTAAQLAPTVNRPDDVFRDGSFSPGTIGAIGYSLTNYLLKSAGPAKYGRLLQELNNGERIEAALQTAYGAPPATIAQAYVSQLR